MNIEQKVARCMDALDARNKEVGFKMAKEWFKTNFGEVGMSEGTFYRAKRVWLASVRKEELYLKVDSVQSPQTLVNKQDEDNISLTDLKRVAVLVKEMGRGRVRKCLECLEEVQVG